MSMTAGLSIVVVNNITEEDFDAITELVHRYGPDTIGRIFAQRPSKPDAHLDQVLPHIRWRIVITDQELHTGAEVPDSYGLAWRDFTQRVNVYMPVPVNVIAGALRAAWHRLRAGYGKSTHDVHATKAVGAAFDRGYMDGFGQGRALGHREGRDAALLSLLANLDGRKGEPVQ